MIPLQEHLANLTLLPDWESRYTYLIELGEELPPMPEGDKTEANKVRGCTSQVWMTARYDANDILHLQLASDAAIVRGLLALAYAAFHGQKRGNVKGLNLPEMLAPTGLLQHLSPNRRNGFSSVLAHIVAA